MSDPNPFASPTTSSFDDSEILEESDDYPIASQNKRFITFFLDNIVVQIFSFASGVVIGLLMIDPARSLSEAQNTKMQLVSFIVGLLISMAYFLVMESLFQKTVGKMVTGTIVVNEYGERPSFAQLLGRTLARFVPFEPFSFLGSKKPVGWHDSWSGTRVVSTR